MVTHKRWTTTTVIGCCTRACTMTLLHSNTATRMIGLGSWSGCWSRSDRHVAGLRRC